MRTVVFDLDGTLADTSGDLIAAANARVLPGLVSRMPSCTRGMTQQLPFSGGRAMLRAGFDRLERAWDEALIDRHYPVLLEAYAESIDVHTTAVPRRDGSGRGAVRDRVRGCDLHQQARSSCASAARQAGGLPAFGKALIGADTLAVRKPDPEPLREAVRRAGGDPARALLVGDTVTDRETSRAAGVPSVLVGFGPRRCNGFRSGA